MERIYKVPEHRIEEYSKRESLRKIKIIAKITSVIMLLLLIFILVKGLPFFLFALFFGVFSALILLMYVIMPFQIGNIEKMKVYILDSNKIEVILNKRGLNTLNQIGAERVNTKYGQNIEQKININSLKYTQLRKNDIKFVCKVYNIFNENGIILLPQEVDNYESLVHFLRNNSEEFRLEDKTI